MKQKIAKQISRWRDILMILTCVLVAASLILISFTVNKDNVLEAQNKALQIQNTNLAIQNQNHIDCIIKDLGTPIPANAKSRIITNASTACDIKFTQ